jgi:hypothetical protein
MAMWSRAVEFGIAAWTVVMLREAVASISYAVAAVLWGWVVALLGFGGVSHAPWTARFSTQLVFLRAMRSRHGCYVGAVALRA